MRMKNSDDKMWMENCLDREKTNIFSLSNHKRIKTLLHQLDPPPPKKKKKLETWSNNNRLDLPFIRLHSSLNTLQDQMNFALLTPKQISTTETGIVKLMKHHSSNRLRPSLA